MQAQQRPDLIGLPRDSADSLLRAHFEARGQPAYRAAQACEWIYGDAAVGFDGMTNLPGPERAALAEHFRLTVPEIDRVSRSRDGTVKHLWKLMDGELIESVLIPTPKRLTLCLSSQAGCAMACAFCATGWAGYRRQLSTDEIVAQYRGARAWARENGCGEITNLVFMGMGEPLMNRSAVVPALGILNGGFGVGARRITVSTVGVVPGILELAALPEQFRLAVSLHAPNHELRGRLVPLERKYPIPALLEALREFDAAGGKRITFEYVMIDGVNDDVALAGQLADLVEEFNAFVNLIPFNPIPGTDWRPTPRHRLDEFTARLAERGVTSFIRESRGSDIAAACGQLRADATHARRDSLPVLAGV